MSWVWAFFLRLEVPWAEHVRVPHLQEERVDRVMEIGQREAEEAMRALAKVEGIFAGGSTWEFCDCIPFTSCTGTLHAE